MALLGDHHIPHEVVEHEPVYTNPVMAEKLGVAVGETVKSLVLRSTEGRILLVVLPGDKRFDAKALAERAGVKKVSFAKPETVKAYAGCEVGCVPPFGHLQPIPVYVDPTLFDRPHVYFNPGVHTKSVKIETARLKELCPMTLL